MGAVRPYVEAHSGLWPLLSATAVAMLCVELPVAFRRRPGAERRDRGSHGVLVVGIGGGLAVLVLSERLRGWSVIRPPVVSLALGVALCVVGILLRGWAIHTLGGYFTTSVRVSADQPVIDSGPYRWVRHPSYTALLGFLVGVGFVVGNWVGVAAIAVGTGGALAYRIRVEERALLHTIGEPYRRYAAGRKRLVPGLW